MLPTVKHRRYQRGWVEIEGAKGQKQYVGRWRADDGSKPKIVLGYVSEMTLTEARARIEAHVRGMGSRPTSAVHITFKDYWTLNFRPRRKVRWSEPTEAGYDQKRVLAKLQKNLELGVPLTFQVLRRSHATRNQKTPKDTQAHLGHKTLAMTLGTYAQAIPDSVREMVERDERETLASKAPADR